MIKVSVIIPTVNRAEYLRNALMSVLSQSFQEDLYEVITVDNGSTDGTKEVVDNLNQAYNDQIRYFYDSRPGLHIGRHLGAQYAKGEILLYGDDDIIASPEWVEEIYRCYSDDKVGAAGGKILPKFETKPPEWLRIFSGDLRNLGYLSLLDLGDEFLEINSNKIYGCNLSIRKDLLFQLGGFHPDAMPEALIKYRGDGETALMNKVVAAGYKTIYNPKAYVYHVISSNRLTLKYFKKRSFHQGVSDSFSLIRKHGGIDEEIFEGKLRKTGLLSRLFTIFMFIKDGNYKSLSYHLNRERVWNAYRQGIKYHKNEVERDPELLDYVLKESYFV